MSLKTYGVYIAFAPGVDLRHEGLGRYLAALLKGAAEHRHCRFVVLCPSWSRHDLQQLFLSEGVPGDRFEIIAPSRVPTILGMHERYKAWRRRPRRKGLGAWLVSGADALKARFIRHIEDRLVHLHSSVALITLLPEVMLAATVIVLASPLLLLGGLALVLRHALKRLFSYLGLVRHLLGRFKAVIASPKDDATVLRLYRRMEEVEAQRMLALAKGRTDIAAWYCPTAFWPGFNAIEAPRLMCVPDVVLSDFPVGFSQVGGDRFVQTFERVERAVRGGEHFVAYSDTVKWNTIVAQYGVQAARVNVIQHAANDLGQWVTVSGCEASDEVSRNYCRTLLLTAMRKATHHSYAGGFRNQDVRFLFYASQFRPNKNVISLLRAYEYLLRRRYVGHKLILTGHPDSYPVIGQFIVQHNLENDVICLHGLSVQELAACYKLADLAVNPSKSEGGFPFTFTEALSVGTPVVMARIGVTEEVVTDPGLQAAMLFEPDDWRQMAERIEWALGNRQRLLAIQTPLYERLAKRTWTDVANQHIELLERICEQRGVSGAR